MGQEGEMVPEMTTDWVNTISERYIELYNKLIDQPFVKESKEFNLVKIQTNYDAFCRNYYA